MTRSRPGPVDTTKSAHARLRTLPFAAVNLGGFWRKRQETNRNASLRHGYQMLAQSGNLHNLALAAGLVKGEYRGPRYIDSNLYKWLEAVGWELGRQPDRELQAKGDEAITLIASAQAGDGYVNSYYQVVAPEQRWRDLAHGHELYCAGHLFQAALAWRRATGDERLLAVACRLADHIDSVFGPQKAPGTPGHPEVEMALIELARETGEERYRHLAAFVLEQRGRDLLAARGGGRTSASYYQDHVPVRQARTVVGHAVRQLYLSAGVTDLYMEQGEEALLAAGKRQWQDMVGTKLYVTGGAGARHEGEAFGAPYELPNERAYAESCAAIGSIMWSWRLLLATGEARYAELIERTLYNAFLVALSLDGLRTFYSNPLLSYGGVERPEWHGCACCPPNIMRLLASLGHYFATTDGDGLQLHQYAPMTVTAALPVGRIGLEVETEYPWHGEVQLRVTSTPRAPWRLMLRLPAWCEAPALEVNGHPRPQPLGHGSYAAVARRWQPGDSVVLRLPMEPHLVEAHPAVDAARDSVAIRRGPLIYCLEQVDHESGVLDLVIDNQAPLAAQYEAELLGGVMAIRAAGYDRERAGWKGHLYRRATRDRPASDPVRLYAVPYYAWANRGAGAMRVWIPRAR